MADGFVTRLVVAGVLAVSTAASAEAQLRLQPYVSGFSQPVGFVQDPTNPSVQFVVEQAGRIRVVRERVVLTDDFLDLSSAVGCCGERGLLGMAFAPDTAVSGRFFVHFTNHDGHTVIARFKRSPATAVVADASSRFDLVWASIGGLPYIPHVPAYGNHNGGDLAFGSDGYLYIGLGDGGSGNDPHNRAQNPNELLGKMLRIDINVADSHANGYQVPADNPFVDGAPITALPEIWSFGLRNPWRFSFDVGIGGTGALTIADVGQNNREEINYEPPGAGGRNYGWRVREGTRNHITTLAPAYAPLVDPIHEYDHSIGFVVTGGFVYRGRGLHPSYRGRYFFADFATARLWSLGLTVDAGTGEASVSDVAEHTAELGGTGVIDSVSSFGRDADGELYLVQYGGSILKLVGPRTRLVLAGDFDTDGDPDLLSQRQTGAVHVALNTGAAFDQIGTVFDGSTSWRIVGVGHFNDDLEPDLVWQSSAGEVQVWLMNGPTVSRVLYVHSAATAWQVVAVADVNHSGSSDLIWQAPSGEVVAWLMHGSTLVERRFMHASPTEWRIVASPDMNGDGDADLLWQYPSGAVFVWFMSGESLSSSGSIYSGVTSWRIISAGDVDGDGRPDIIWQGPHEHLAVWLMQGLTLSGVRYIKADGLGWRLSNQP